LFVRRIILVVCTAQTSDTVQQVAHVVNTVFWNFQPGV